MNKSSHIQRTAWIMVLLVTLILITGSSFSQVTLEAAKGTPTTVPATINYQGRLLGSDGKPLSGDHALSIKIYTQETEGNAVWGPQLFAAVPVVNGHFNIILGPTDTNGLALADVFSTNPNTWLQVTVDNNPVPILTRQKILSVPYAVQAEKAVEASRVTGPLNIDAVGIPSSEYTLKTPATWTAVPGLNLNIRSTGRPVIVTLTGNHQNTYGFVYGSGEPINIQIRRDGTNVTGARFSGTNEFPLSLVAVDVPGVGEHTYSVWMRIEAVSGEATIYGAKLQACEQ